VPPVVTPKEKARRKRDEEAEKKHVDIDEHLMEHADVADRYKTRVNFAKPADSLGLTSLQAEELLHQYGPNVLTPPKKRHPLLKFLDCLKSLFNLLLILAGILEYILLAIDFKDNFQNVRVTTSLSVTCLANSRVRPTLELSSLPWPSSMPSSSFTNSRSPRLF
jgi:sodium/potassium-transporting ATPase subunit alpha